METKLVIDIALCIVAAWVLGLAFQKIRQPLLLAYLLAGFSIGPYGFKWITDPHSIETISSIGLVLLLFMIGLEIDLKKMASAGRLITVTAAVQIFGCIFLGWGFFKVVGLVDDWFEALYLGVAVGLSSTVIIVKILYDKHELDTLAGRVTLGILVLQDLAAILFLAIQPNLKHPEVGIVAVALGKVVMLLSLGLLVSRYVLPRLFKSSAHTSELVLVGALAWCFALAGLANFLGLSREMGALVAGVCISTYPYTLDIAAKVTNIRDFFVTLFFVGLGMSIPWPSWALVIATLSVSAFLIFSRLITVFPVLYRMRQGHRMSLLPAVNLCQMSELSLVLLTLGKASGDVSNNTVTIGAFTFAFLAMVSTYAITANDALLRASAPWLNWCRLPDLPESATVPGATGRRKRVFLLGFASTASSLFAEMSRETPSLIQELTIVDFNPQVNEALRGRGVEVLYGDISQRDTLLHAGIAEAEVIVCVLPNSLLKGTNNLKLVRLLRSLNQRAQVIVHAETLADISNLYASGADYVLVPRLLEAQHLLKVIDAALKRMLEEKRTSQEKQLAERGEIIP